MAAVASSVPSATSSPSAPLFTTAKATTAPYPAPVVTGPAATGQAPEKPPQTGKTVQWRKSPTPGLRTPQGPQGELGDPAPIPPGSAVPFVQGAVVRGQVTPVASKGRPNTREGGASQWSRTTRYGLNDVQSQDADSAGWINRHPNDRPEFTRLSGAEDEANLYYWPMDTSQNPILTPLAVTGARTGSSWTPQGVSSAYTEPAPFQPTAAAPGGTYADPAEEWM